VAGGKTIYTIGHSTRPAMDFIALLQAAGVQLLADVRAYPASRRHPQFGREALTIALQARGIAYTWMGAALGGHREARADTPNTGLAPVWRGYADHTQTPRYRAGLAQLEEQALTQSTVIMCAERNPDDCHRNLISDSLVGHGWNVVHLIGAKERRVHQLHPAAQPGEDGLIYPGAGERQLGLEF
jgi:uncharacterized protein (DUF488 family)